MKTFVLDFIQCRTFLSVLYRVRDAQSVFIRDSVFYTQSVILSPRFTPESVFYIQSVVRSPSVRRQYFILTALAPGRLNEFLEDCIEYVFGWIE